MLGCMECGSDVMNFTSDSQWQCMACGHKDTQLRTVGTKEAVSKIRAGVLREIEEERISKLKRDTDYIRARVLHPTKYRRDVTRFDRVDKMINEEHVRWKI